MRALAILSLSLPILLVVLDAAARAQVTVSSPSNKHNLSVNSSGTVRSTGTTEICIFCHAPHNAKTITAT